MRKMAVQGVAAFLPEEIMINILKRLPVKSLVRFQCVCKHWKNLFKTPSFVADHLHHSSMQNPSLLIKQHSSRELLHLRLIDGEMHVLEVRNPSLIFSKPKVRIFGSCNGLLCIGIDEFDISFSSFLLCNSLLLWNPAIREVRQIPRTRAVSFEEWSCTVGFGFSATVNDYRVVKTYADRGDVIIGVEVYSLYTGSWKEIEFGSLEGASLYGDAVTANGSIFWYGEKRGVEEEDGDDINLVVSFDIATEVFTLITGPPLSDDSSFQFNVYEDKFAVLSGTRIAECPNYPYSLIDLWVLEEDMGSSTEKWRWTKKWSSNPCPSTLHHKIIWRNEIVCIDFGVLGVTDESGHEMENEQKGGLCFIDISTKELKRLVSPRCGSFPIVFNHVESLVPVGNIHYEEP